MPVVPAAMTEAEMHWRRLPTALMARTLLIGATADEMHAFFAANPAMEIRRPKR